MQFDPYVILGVGHDALIEQLRTAYHRAAKRCHPDAGGTHEAMIAVITAWKILSDPVRRAAYDSQYAAWRAAQAESEPHPSSDPWYSVKEEAQDAAAEEAPRTREEWDRYLQWLDEAVADVQRTSRGRVASAAVSGALLGGCLGMIAGWWLGIGATAGGAMGLFVGALAAAITVLKRREAQT